MTGKLTAIPPKFKGLNLYGEAQFIKKKKVINSAIHHKEHWLTNPIMKKVYWQHCYLFQNQQGEFFAQSLGGSMVLPLEKNPFFLI